MRLGRISYWYDDMGGLPARRAPLEGDAKAEVCIIGAGYTGLWAAYTLKQLSPDLDVLILEKSFAGAGASGRNGGWLTGGFAWDHGRYGPLVSDLVTALRGAVEAVIATAEREGIDADIHRTDELTLAVNAAQAARMADEVALRQSMGEPVTLMEGSALTDRVHVPSAVGAMVTPGVARIQPAKLVQGLARAVERMGVRIAEETEVTRIAPGEVETTRGVVTARTVLRATEGYTAGIPGLKRAWLPLNSAQIVTAPLPDAIWQEIGWRGRELIGDFANVYCYCQRTRDGRIAVGSRGVPYLFGSRTDSDGAPDPVTVRRLMAILSRYFPAAAEAKIAHAWCGVLGVPRDWCATVGFDAETRIGWAGGYVGVGVSTSNLAGRTLADLTLGRDTDLTRLAWVNRPVKQWEPEPLRWLGVRGMYGLLHLADAQEARGGGPSRWSKLGYWLAGR
ncbi:MAG: FAD-dependent oxidoreductase [Pseudomonadota bacterium]